MDVPSLYNNLKVFLDITDDTHISIVTKQLIFALYLSVFRSGRNSEIRELRKTLRIDNGYYLDNLNLINVSRHPSFIIHYRNHSFEISYEPQSQPSDSLRSSLTSSCSIATYSAGTSSPICSQNDQSEQNEEILRFYGALDAIIILSEKIPDLSVEIKSQEKLPLQKIQPGRLFSDNPFKLFLLNEEVSYNNIGFLSGISTIEEIVQFKILEEY